MNSKFKLLGVALALSCGAASAGVIQVGGVAAGANGEVSAQPGVCTVDFNGGNAAFSPSTACSLIDPLYTGASASNFRTGTAYGRFASPAGDTTGFMTVGPTDGNPVTVTLAVAANYFGFYAGSLDTYNLVQFYNGSTLIDSFTGAQINAVAFPNQAATGNQAQAQYIDYLTSSLYTSLVISSSGDAFETDNHAFGFVAQRTVPEPDSAALLGLGALGFLVVQRRRKL